MEAAGLTIGVVSLFSSCIQGYEALRTIRDQGKEAAMIACCLEIEEKRLVLWGRNAGLLDATCLIPARDLDTVISTLRQIDVITKDADTLKARYGLKVDTVQKDAEGRAPNCYLLGAPELPNQDIQGPQSSKSFRLSVRWLFDRKNFEKLIEDLRRLNNGLNALLQEGQMTNYRRDFAMMALQSTSTDNANTLRVIREAAQSAYDNLSQASGQRLHSLMLQASRLPGVQAGYGTARLIPMPSINILSPNEGSSRAIGVLGSTPVLLEWRRHNCESLDTVSLLLDRAEGLAALLGRTPKPRSFRVLDCIGYCHDEVGERIGLIFRLPDQMGGISETMTLRDLLQSRRQSAVPLPTLHNRFQLASTLANGLLQFHAAKWLHRNFSSANIILPCRSQHSQDMYLDQYICGFGYSREESPQALSLPISICPEELPYQHPDIVSNPRQGYNANFDAYSLGIVLLEIGYWRPIDSFLKSHYTPLQSRDRLLRHQLGGDLAHRMGEKYEEATRRLLSGCAYGDQSDEGNRLIQFFQNIVVPIESSSRNE
ncbi:prion-inhibition and propagation-domain-containing protein [Ilyonectria destructans]|nr:prion-inhibition and propagation-domain-containing protein [Ilyonectria destructans]